MQDAWWQTPYTVGDTGTKYIRPAAESSYPNAVFARRGICCLTLILKSWHQTAIDNNSALCAAETTTKLRFLMGVLTGSFSNTLCGLTLKIDRSLANIPWGDGYRGYTTEPFRFDSISAGFNLWQHNVTKTTGTFSTTSVTTVEMNFQTMFNHQHVGCEWTPSWSHVVRSSVTLWIPSSSPKCAYCLPEIFFIEVWNDASKGVLCRQELALTSQVPSAEHCLPWMSTLPENQLAPQSPMRQTLARWVHRDPGANFPV